MRVGHTGGVDRVYSLLVGAAITLGLLGMGVAVAQLVAPPPDSELGGRVVVDAGPTPPAPSQDPSPGPPASPEPSSTATPPARVPVNPPVVVDDDDDDDRDDDDRDDGEDD
jgi:hypothetical protein